MRIATATLRSVSPYSQSGFLKSERGPKEAPDDHEKRVWRERMHINKDGKVFIPPMAFKNALQEAAMYNPKKIPGRRNATYTKHFMAGILVVDPLVLPIKGEDVEGEWGWYPSDGKRGGSSKVKKCYPVVPEWSGRVSYMVLDDTITQDAFMETLIESGRFIGIGRFRPRNGGYYGRFEVEKVDWS